MPGFGDEDFLQEKKTKEDYMKYSLSHMDYNSVVLLRRKGYRASKESNIVL